MPTNVHSWRDLDEEDLKILPAWALDTEGLKQWLSQGVQSAKYNDHITNKAPLSFSTKENYMLYCDGSSVEVVGDYHVGAWAYIAKFRGEIIAQLTEAESHLSPGRTELMPVLRGLQVLGSAQAVRVHTDSEYVTSIIHSSIRNECMERFSAHQDVIRALEDTFYGKNIVVHNAPRNSIPELADCDRIARKARKDYMKKHDLLRTPRKKPKR